MSRGLTGATQPRARRADNADMLKVEVCLPWPMIREALQCARMTWCRTRTPVSARRVSAWTVQPFDDEKAYTYRLGDVREAVAKLALRYPRMFANLIEGHDLPEVGNHLVQIAAGLVDPDGSRAGRTRAGGGWMVRYA